MEDPRSRVGSQDIFPSPPFFGCRTRFAGGLLLGYKGGWTITPATGPKYKAGQPMAKHKLSPEQLAAVKELAKQWGKIVAKNAYGPDGPPLDTEFDEMEQLAAAATAGLVE